MLYEKVSTDLNFVDREMKVLDFWKQNDIFRKSIKLREGHPRFTLIEAFDGKRQAPYRPR